jgi:hypothetical protein
LTLKKGNKYIYGEPFTMVTGLSAIILFCFLISPWIVNYYNLMAIIFYGGLIGFFIEFIFLKIPILLKIRSSKSQILILLHKYKLIFGLLIQSIVYVFIYSAVWPSGEMETWISTSTDFYFWPLMSDYHMGKIDPLVFPLARDFYFNIQDSFGTHLIFGLFTIASNESALLSWPTIAVTLMVWSGASIQNMVSKIYGFGFWPSLIVAMGVFGGAFYNYVVFTGMMGQLVSIFCFLTALERILHWTDSRWPGVGELKDAFPPILLLFLAYQGGYIAFASMIAMVAAFIGFFIPQNITISNRISRGLIWGIYPISILTIVSSILQPVTAIHLFKRTLEVAEQPTGWTIPFLDPWLVSGIPIYKKNYFFGEDIVSPLVYIPFIGIIILLSYLYIKLKKYILLTSEINNSNYIKIHDNSLNYIWAINISFITSLAIYLGAFLVLGQKYQVWKFASFICLPLSFVPFALLTSYIKYFWLINYKKNALIITLSFILYFIYTLSQINPLINLKKVVYKADSAKKIISIYEYIFNNNKDSILISYLNDNASSLLFAEFFKGQNTRKLITVVPIPNFFHHLDIKNILNTDKKLAIVSDRQFSHLFNAERGRANPGIIFLLDKTELLKNGFITLFGVYINDNWNLDKMNIFRFTVNVPVSLYDKPIKLKISIGISKFVGNPENCFQKMRLSFAGSPEFIYGEESAYEIETSVPPDLISNGSFSGRVKIMQSNDSPSNESCGPIYILDKIEVTEDRDTVTEFP